MSLRRPIAAFCLFVLPVCVTICPDEAAAVPAMLSTVAETGSIPFPIFEFTLPCDRLDGCRNHGAAQQPDRQVRPFEGTLGRPCAYRWRATPSGTRKVRICS